MDQIYLCECLICGDHFFRVGDIVTVGCFKPGVGNTIRHGRITRFDRIIQDGWKYFLILDTSSTFNAVEETIAISDINNICTYEKGEEK